LIIACLSKNLRGVFILFSELSSVLLNISIYLHYTYYCFFALMCRDPGMNISSQSSRL